MKATLFHRHGATEVLEYTDFPTPDPGPGEVLVRLRAAALNRVDILVRQGWPGLKLDMPHINGADGAGEVAATSREIEAFSTGDRVVINANLGCGDCPNCRNGQDNLCQDWRLLGETRRGTYAEYVCLPARQLYHLPNDFSYHLAAAAALVYQTAWHSLIKRGRLSAGESVLIVGASGGVNTASIQIAKYTGATVYVVGSSKEKLSLADSLGADVLIDRSLEENWAKTVYRLTDKRGVDVVVDNVGTTYPLSFRAVRKGGRILNVGSTGGPRFEIDNRYLFGKHISLLGSTMSTTSDFKEVMNLITTGKLKPIVDRTYPLKDAHIAQERLEHNEQMGKITLDIP
ncbi:MAG: zinc-binding dehydrogenase [Anaerolineales bacterium]|nr:zinc-binding dehydrogenase [Anaerolineales bacterium]